MRDRPALVSGAALTAAEIARSVVAEQTKELAGRQKHAAKGEDPDDVHRMRVATRRLRSALRLVGADFAVRDRLERRLAWIARRLGRVRDQDVMLGLLAGATGIRGAEAQRLARLRRKLRERRALAQDDLREALGRRRWRGLLKELRSFARAPRLLPEVDAVTPRILARVDELGAGIAALPAMRVGRPTGPALHELRIAFKRLRYVLEVNAAVDTLAYGTELRMAREIQDVLGLLHDHDLVLEKLDRGRGPFAGEWRRLRPMLQKERTSLLRRFQRLRAGWIRRTTPAPAVPVDEMRFVNLEPQPVTLRLVSGG